LKEKILRRPLTIYQTIKFKVGLLRMMLLNLGRMKNSYNGEAPCERLKIVAIKYVSDVKPKIPLDDQFFSNIDYQL
jgi:hypothetical protein